MQLTLSHPVSLRTRTDPARGAPTPLSRDAVMSQLDLIAASGNNLPQQGLGGGAMLLAILGGLLVVALATLLNGAETPRPNAPAAAPSRISAPLTAATPAAAVGVAEPKAATAPAQLPAAVADPSAASVVRLTAAEPEYMPLMTAPADNTPSMVDAVIKAPPERALADANRVKAARAATAARSRAAAAAAAQRHEEEQREAAARAQEQHLAQETLARQQAADKAKAAQAQRLAALEERRTVAQTCSASGGFVGQQFCIARECRSADNQRDAVCVRLREQEEAQRQAGLLR